MFFSVLFAVLYRDQHCGYTFTVICHLEPCCIYICTMTQREPSEADIPNLSGENTVLIDQKHLCIVFAIG